MSTRIPVDVESLAGMLSLFQGEKTHSWAKIEILFKTLIPMQGTKFCAFPDLQTCRILISSFNLLDDVVLIQLPLVRLYMWPHIMMWQQVKATKKKREINGWCPLLTSCSLHGSLKQQSLFYLFHINWKHWFLFTMSTFPPAESKI